MKSQTANSNGQAPSKMASDENHEKRNEQIALAYNAPSTRPKIIISSSVIK